MSDNSSENSMVRTEVGDINVKYGRLAAEYSKIRAQNAVLQKAIVEEQNKTAQLSDIIREKDQAIRKTSQETESLNFRNSQLLRRVTVLQEEIDLMNKNGKKKTKNTADIWNGVVDNPLLEEDMKKTIIENAKLISKLNDKEEKYEGEVASLMRQISALNDEVNQKNTQVQQMRMEYEFSIDQLRKEQQDFKRDYANNVNKLKETEIELSTLKSAHKLYVDKVDPKLEAISRVLAKKIPFLDEEIPELNSLNVRYFLNPCDDVASVELLQKYFSELVLIFYNIIHNVTFELKQLGFNELKIYVKTLLNENDGVLLNEKLNACIHMLETIELDFNAPNNVEYMVKKFMKIFLDFCTTLCSSYLSRCSTPSVNSEKKAFSSLSRAVQVFKTTTNELIESIISQPNSQKELIREEFAKLNVALDNLVAESKKVDLKRAQGNTARLNDDRDYKSTASKYLRSLHKEKCEYVPYEEAIDNKKRLQELIMLNNSLTAELKNLETTIAAFEQEKVHLRNKCEVLQIKLDSRHSFRDTEIEPAPEVTNELGKFTPAESIGSEILAREQEIQRHMLSKLDEIVIMKEEACSKARTLLLECKTLQRRLENNAVEKQLLENKYLEANRGSLELREELTTISQNYEVQLSMMSDHLASVNEKLAQQSEEIDNLKYQLSNKISKKSKQK